MTPLGADAALALALGIHAELLTRLRRVEASPPWWLGYARDGTNLSAGLMLWGAYLLAGFPAAVALCAAMLTTLVTYLADWTLARALRMRRVRLALALPLAGWVAVVALAAPQLEGALDRLVTAVQPR
jgi:hypothetical protein